MSDVFVSVCRNLFEHVAYVQANTQGMLVLQEDGFWLVDSGLASDTFNKILCPEQLVLNGNLTKDFQSRLVLLGRHFSGRERTNLFLSSDMFLPQAEGERAFTVWTGTKQPENEGRICTVFGQAGYEKTEEETGMFLQLSQLGTYPSQEISGIKILPVRNPAQLDAFSGVLAANWSPPDMDVSLFFRRGEGALLSEQGSMQLFVAIAGEEPVGCGELFLSEGHAVAGLHMISVLEKWRRRGIGSAITTALLMAGRKAGAGQAVLLASAMGKTVYSRQGFESCGKFFEFSLMDESVVF